MLAITPPLSSPDDLLFARIADDLSHQGYTVIHNALPDALASSLFDQVMDLDSSAYNEAGIGRQNELTLNQFVRRDEICWIEGQSPAEHDWLKWTAGLQQYLNQYLFLGLFSFESHFKNSFLLRVISSLDIASALILAKFISEESCDLATSDLI